MLKKFAVISTFQVSALIALCQVSLSAAYAQPTPKIESIENSRRQAGLWQQIQTLTVFDLPRAQPAIAKAAKTSLGRPVVSPPECVTPAQTRTDNLASRLAIITPQGTNFVWARLNFENTMVRASGSDARSLIEVDGKITPVLTDIQVSTITTDPVFGQVRRVQRTRISWLGSC
jgi:hypothetical protein